MLLLKLKNTAVVGVGIPTSTWGNPHVLYFFFAYKNVFMRMGEFEYLFRIFVSELELAVAVAGGLSFPGGPLLYW